MDHTTHTSADRCTLGISAGEKRGIKLADLIEVRNLGDIAQVDHGEVLHFLCHTIESLVHGHALGIPVVAEPNDDDPVLLGFDGLVDVPAGGEVREEVRHGWGARSRAVSHFEFHATRSSWAPFRPLLPSSHPP